MTVKTEHLTLDQLGEYIFKLSANRLPSSPERLKRSLVAECIRLALETDSKKDGNGGRVHVLAIRSWVIRKLRAVMTEFLEGNQSLFLDVLNESKAPTLEFLGDVIPLSGGYYCATPTRAVEISDDRWVLVSGAPTYKFSDMGMSIRIHDVSRHIEGFNKKGLIELGIPIQTRESYAGLTQSSVFNEDSFKSLDKEFERYKWLPGPDWEEYIGNMGQWGFQWGQRNVPVSSPAGLISLWRQPQEMNDYQHWLRVISGDTHLMYKIPRWLYKYVCLTIDMLTDQIRQVETEETDGGVVVSMNFSLPAPQTRWLHAVGAKWLEFQGNQISWLVPAQVWKSTEEVLKKLPIQISIKKAHE